MKDTMDGLLLGDSSLQHRGKHLGITSFPRFGHNCKHIEFNAWIQKVLTEFGLQFGPTHTKPNGYGTGYTYQTFSHVSPNLCDFFTRWYPFGKKVLPKDITLSPRTVNLWYCGDGGFDTDKGYLRQICLCAHSFDPTSREFLSEQLRKIGFKSRAARDGKITVSKNSIPAFLNWIGHPPVGCYRYKWEHYFFTSKQPKYRTPDT